MVGQFFDPNMDSHTFPYLVDERPKNYFPIWNIQYGIAAMVAVS